MKTDNNSLPNDILKSINLDQDESILMWLRGAFKEWLVCTNRQVFIIKKGFMTGHFFGSNVYQMPYKNIMGATVNYHLTTGYFELNTGGMENSTKDYWSSDAKSDPKQAPNCISILGKDSANEFRKACAFISNKVSVSEQTQINNNMQQKEDIPTLIRKLADLKTQGILTENEFETKKKELLSKM